MNESPTFIAEFADGEVTKMTTFSSIKKLDVERGIRLAKHAYEQRTGKEPPAMVAARFEQDGQLLASYSAVDLDDLEEEAPL
jgi:hypothetical protein